MADGVVCCRPTGLLDGSGNRPGPIEPVGVERSTTMGSLLAGLTALAGIAAGWILGGPVGEEPPGDGLAAGFKSLGERSADRSGQ